MSLPAQITLPTTTLTEAHASPAMAFVPPAAVRKPTTASPAPLELRRSLTLLRRTPNTALRPASRAPTPMARTAEVSETHGVVCASNCQTCTSGSASGCSLCVSGYFSHPTNSNCVSSCPSSSYANSGSRTCITCNTACSSCNGSANTNCLSCASQYYSAGGNTCLACDSRCNGCSGPGNTQCSSCASGKFSQQGVSGLCVNACSNIGANYYAHGSVCKQCDSLCGTCSGGQAYNCLTCASGKVEIVDSPLRSPKHCTASCGSDNGTYLDGSDCRGEL